MPFLPPIQQRQSTEGSVTLMAVQKFIFKNPRWRTTTILKKHE